MVASHAVFTRQKESSQDGVSPVERKVASCDERRLQRFRWISGHGVRGGCPCLKLLEALRPLALCLDRLVPRAVRVALQCLLPDDGQPIGFVARQWSQQDGIDQAENRRVRADAERQRQHGNQCEARVVLRLNPIHQRFQQLRLSFSRPKISRSKFDPSVEGSLITAS